MFERFTERARQVVVLAQDEARVLRHNYIGTEHILLGLLREEEGLAARVLWSFDITVEKVRAQVARIVGEGDEVTTGQIPFTPRGKKVLELSLREALSLGHNYIGTEHMLLGLVRENEGVAARILLDFGADAETIRNEVMRMLSLPGRREEWGEVPDEYVPSSPPFASDFAEAVDAIRREKEAALEHQQFEKAAWLRDKERRLVTAAHHVERILTEPVPEPSRPPSTRGPLLPHEEFEPPGGRRQRVWFGSRMPRRVSPQRRIAVFSDYPRRAVAPLIIGWLLFGAALGAGLALGWLIWG